MPPPNHQFPALPKAPARPSLWLLLFLFSTAPILFLGCAGATSGAGQFFGSSSTATESENPVLAPTAAAASAPASTATAGQSSTNKKSASEVHIAVEKASQASETAAEASQKELQASKQARQAAYAASRAEGSAGSGKSIVTLETPGPASRSTPGDALAADGVPTPTPAARPKSTADLKSVSSATASLPVVASAGESNPVDAEKLIDDLDKTEKRIDRSNLSADESQRDVLAQRLLKDAKKALADRDNIAAMSLATKASILLAPLPKVPGPASSSMR
jgi:trimeric autotransporter adhesin